MQGTLVNVAAIIAGSIIGLLIKKGIPPRLSGAIVQAQGLAIIILALNGVIGSMFTVGEDGRLSDSGGLLLLVSLVLGMFFGELMRIDDHIESGAGVIERKVGASGFAKGLVTASLVFCIGAMSILGALYDGLGRGSDLLFLKSMLDFTTAVILASSLGIGVMFAAVPVLILQGGISLAAMQLEPYLIGSPLLDHICMIGYSMVLCIGFNFLLETKIKVANLLPALLVPIVYSFIF